VNRDRIISTKANFFMTFVHMILINEQIGAPLYNGSGFATADHV